MAKLILVVPLFYNAEYEMPIMEYQGFTTLNAYLSERGHEVTVIDAFCERMNFNEVVEKICSQQADFIGFTLMSSMYMDNMNRILEYLKNKNGYKMPQIFAGGVYATMMSREIMENNRNIRYIVRGDGEYTIDELISGLGKGKLEKIKGIVYQNERGNIVENPIREPLTEEELTAFPMPKHQQAERIIREGGVLQIVTSRGCYGNCIFCGVNEYGKQINCDRWRGISAERVIEQIEYLYRTYQVHRIDIADDNFIGKGERGKKRAFKIARLIQEKHLPIQFNMYCRINDFDEELFIELKKAGLRSVFIGVEFGIQRSLDFYSKGITAEQSKKVLSRLRHLGIKPMEGFIMFEPLMTVEEIKQNLKFFYENCDFRLYKIATKLEVLRYSKAYEKLKDLIVIEQKPEFTYIFGDVCRYSFKHPEVEILYECINQDLSSIMPSKAYQYIFMKYDNNEKLVKRWKEGIFRVLSEFIEAFEKEDMKLLIEWKKQRVLRNKLRKFDTDYYIELKQQKEIDSNNQPVG